MIKKYRAWDIEEKRMRVDSRIALTSEGKVILTSCPESNRVLPDPDGRFIVMFAVGKDDMNGIPIYQDDVVEVHGNGFNPHKRMVRSIIDVPDQQWQEGSHNESGWMARFKYKVIGNIYENRELRKHTL